MINPMNNHAIKTASQVIYNIHGEADDNGDKCSLYLLMKEGNEMGSVGSRFTQKGCTTSILIITSIGILAHTAHCLCTESETNADMEQRNMANILVEITPYLLSAGFVFPLKASVSAYEKLGRKWIDFLDWNDYYVEKIY